MCLLVQNTWLENFMVEGHDFWLILLSLFVGSFAREKIISTIYLNTS